MQIGESREVVRHEGDVGRFESHVASGGAHGDPHARRGERRAVVDPIPHHRRMPVLDLQLPHHIHLVRRLQLGVDLVDADLACDRVCCRVVVSGEHHGVEAR